MNEGLQDTIQSFADCADELWDLTKDIDARAAYLTNQLMRAIDSTGANLAEGSGRGSPGSMRQFFGYALGSALEAQFWLERAVARKLITVKAAASLFVRLQDNIKAVTTLIASLGRGKS